MQGESGPFTPGVYLFEESNQPFCLKRVTMFGLGPCKLFRDGYCSPPKIQEITQSLGETHCRQQQLRHIRGGKVSGHYSSSAGQQGTTHQELTGFCSANLKGKTRFRKKRVSYDVQTAASNTFYESLPSWISNKTQAFQTECVFTK